MFVKKQVRLLALSALLLSGVSLAQTTTPTTPETPTTPTTPETPTTPTTPETPTTPTTPETPTTPTTPETPTTTDPTPTTTPTTTDTTTPAPATTDTTTPATTDTTTTPTAAASASTPVTLAALDGVTPLKTVTTVLGQAQIYPSSTTDVLSRTIEQLKAEGYTVTDQSDSGATLTKDGGTYTLSVVQNDKLGLIVVSLGRKAGK